VGDEGKEGTRWAQQYRVGQAVQVYYAPDEPERAVLRRGAPVFEVGLKACLSAALLALAVAFARRAAALHGASRRGVARNGDGG
jgi:hypothetical protein